MKQSFYKSFFFLALFLFSSCQVLALNPVSDRLYTGQIKDNSGLYYYNARYYDPNLGIFTSADRAQGPNRYAYVGGNPVMRNDPSGMAMATDDSGGMPLSSPPSLWQNFWQNTYEKNRDLIDPLADAGKTWYSGFQDLPWYEKPAVALGVPIMIAGAVGINKWASNPQLASDYAVSKLEAPSSGLGMVVYHGVRTDIVETIKKYGLAGTAGWENLSSEGSDVSLAGDFARRHGQWTGTGNGMVIKIRAPARFFEVPKAKMELGHMLPGEETYALSTEAPVYNHVTGYNFEMLKRYEKYSREYDIDYFGFYGIKDPYNPRYIPPGYIIGIREVTGLPTQIIGGGGGIMPIFNFLETHPSPYGGK